MEEQESRARALMKEGDAALRRRSVWDAFSSSSARAEEARDKYAKAANLFKMAQAWTAAGEAFEKCAQMDDQMEAPHEALNDQIQAAEMYKRVDAKKAVAMFRAAAQKSCEGGRFARAAQLLENSGEMMEQETDLEGALESYQKAADYYYAENATAKGAKAQEKVALLYATLGTYDRAAEIFEKLGTACLDSSLMKFGAKKHYMHAGFCLLARGDVVAARLGFDRFAQLDLSFAGSREAQLLKKLTDAYDAFDGDAFSSALVDYDSVSTLSGFETTMLLRVKNAISAVADAEPDLRCGRAVVGGWFGKRAGRRAHGGSSGRSSSLATGGG